MADTPQATPVDVAAYDVTRHWGLPLYNDATPMDMRDGYNHAMRMIDKILTQLQTQIRMKIKFDGSSFSIIDMLQGDGGAGYLDFNFSMSCFQ